MNRRFKIALVFIAFLAGGYLSLVLGMFLWGLFLPYSFIGAMILGPIYVLLTAPQLKKLLDKLYPEDKF